MGRYEMIMLDTHAWLWWNGSEELLSKQAVEQIEQADTIGVSVISCWEIAKLVEKSRLRLDRDVQIWTKQALSHPRVKALVITPEIATRSVTSLPDFHADPADRFIVATAQVHQVPLLTKDQKILDYPKVKSFW